MVDPFRVAGSGAILGRPNCRGGHRQERPRAGRGRHCSSASGNRPIATALAVAALTALGGHIASAAPVPIVDDTGAIAAPSSTQISFAHTPTGLRAGTANEHESRADVSIVKMYPAEYVLTYVDPADHADATEMIRSSNDAIADRLHAEYPQAISSTAAEFGLTDTHVPGYWGVGTTSTHDMVTYRETKKRTDPGSPVLAAMATAYDTAVDGYPQDYGTALIAGVIGTKRGWSETARSTPPPRSVPISRSRRRPTDRQGRSRSTSSARSPKGSHPDRRPVLLCRIARRCAGSPAIRFSGRPRRISSTGCRRSSPIRSAADPGRHQMRRVTDTTVPSTTASSPSRTG